MIRLDDVTVTQNLTTLTNTRPTYTVQPLWHGVDRPHGVAVGVDDKEMAEAVANAMRDGVWFTHAHILTDVNEKTYVSATVAAYGRHIKPWLLQNGYL